MRFNETPHFNDGEGHLREWSYCEFKLENFMQYGLGTFFYYEDLMKFAIVFLIFSITTSLTMLCYMEGGNDQLLVNYQIEQFSLGNNLHISTHLHTHIHTHARTHGISLN